MSGPIVIQSVSLAGFGRYKEEVRAEFPRGLGIWVGPNEQGKSTLVAGVLAILFGLPQTADPGAFGAGRYRHWDGPAQFWGEMTLEVGGVGYRVRRNFDNHRISLSRLAKSGWIEEVAGEHNPVARRPNPAYIEWLHSLFRHASRELFQSTFCVVQPLPHVERIDAELQSLLAGAGSDGHEPALERLVQAAKRLTKETKSRGLTPRDGRTPGKLDELNAEIASLKEAIEASSQIVLGLQETAARLAEIRDTLGERHNQLDRVKKSVQAYREWREHARNVQRLTAEIRRLTRSKEMYADHKARWVTAKEEQERLYPELLTAPEGLGDGLARVEELIAVGVEVDRLVHEAGRLAGECAALKEEIQALGLSVPEGERAVSWVRRLLRDLEEAIQAWREFAALRQELAAIDGQLEQEYAVFQEAAPATLAAVESYDDERTRWSLELERAVRELERGDEAAKEAAIARERIEERFPQAARHAAQYDQIRALIRHSTQLGEMEARLENLRDQRNKRMFGAVAAAVAGGILAWAGQLWAGLVVWVLGLATAASALLSLFYPGHRRLQAEIASLEEESAAVRKQRAAIAQTLGEVGELSTGELEALAEDIRLYTESLELIRPLEAQAPDPEERRRREQAVLEIQNRLQSLEDALAAPKGAFDDFQEAYRAWRRLRAQRDEIEAALERTLAAWGLSGVHSSDVEQVPVSGTTIELKGVWQRLLVALPVMLQEPRIPDGGRFGGLIEGVIRAQQNAEALMERAREHDRLVDEVARVESERNVLLAPGEKGVIRAHLDRARRLCDQLAAQFGGDWQPMWEAIARRVQDPQDPQGRHDSQALRVPEDCQDHGASLTPGALIERLPPVFREPLLAGGGVDGARRRWQAFGELADAIEHARREMASILRAYECHDPADLEDRLILAEVQLKGELEAMEQLAKDFPSLPAPGVDGADVNVDERLADLLDDERRLEQEIDALEGELSRLTLRQAELQGGTPMNIAEAELRLRALCEQEERLRLELDALCLAHQELTQAAVEFYDGHLGRLEERASRYFQAMSQSAGRRVSLDAELKVMAIEADGQRVLPVQLSQGAKDQLYLSLRLAIGDLLSGESIAPYLLDDPFLNCDEQRLEAIREALVELARDRQILLFTHRKELADWGEPIVLTRGGDGGKGS